MKKNFKKILSLMLTSFMLIAMVGSITVFADDGNVAANVAKIGDTEYATLQAAMTEANKAAGEIGRAHV